MNEIKIAGIVTKIDKNIFNKKQFDEDIAWIQNKYGFFAVGIDKILCKSINVGDNILLFGELKNKCINKDDKNDKILYISANRIYQNDRNLEMAKIKISLKLNKIISILGQTSLIFADFEGKTLNLETNYDVKLSSESFAQISGYIMPHVLDKHNLLEYIIKVDKIENVNERERG